MSNEIEVETNEAPAQEVVETNEPETTETEVNDEVEEVESESEESETAEEKPKNNGFQKRINKLTKQRLEKEQEAEYWKKVALEKSQKNQEQETADQPAQKTGEPIEDDFDDYEEFLLAKAEYRLEKKIEAKEETKRKEAQRVKKQEQVQVFQERLNSFRSEKSDFDDLIESVDDMKTSPAIEEAILTSDVPGQLMYELAKNPDELRRLNSLSPLAASREIGKMEAKFSKSETAPKKKTNAPAPLKTVGSGTGVKVVKDLGSPDLSFAEYEAARKKQLKG